MPLDIAKQEQLLQIGVAAIEADDAFVTGLVDEYADLVASICELVPDGEDPLATTLAAFSIGLAFGRAEAMEAINA